MSETVTVRDATVHDMGAVREIFNHYVVQSTSTFQIEPETADDRVTWFEDRDPRHPVLVAESGGEVVGWAALSPWKSRCAYADAAEFSVYVRHDRHRRGIGRALLAELIERGRTIGLHTIIGGACTEQSASIALQRSFGFEQVACFREVGEKFGRRLDVAYMQLIL